MSAYVNKFYPDYINEERLIKLLDAYISKATPFYILYTADDLEYFKTIDPTIASIDDILKLEENIFVIYKYNF